MGLHTEFVLNHPKRQHVTYSVRVFAHHYDQCSWPVDCLGFYILKNCLKPSTFQQRCNKIAYRTRAMCKDLKTLNPFAEALLQQFQISLLRNEEICLFPIPHSSQARKRALKSEACMHVISVQGFTVTFPLKLNAPTTSSLRWQRSRFLMANEAAIKTSCPQRHKEIETQKQRQRGLRIQLAVDHLLACKLRHSNEQEFWSRSWQQAWGIHSAVQNV